jgi:hypothetical protein
LQIKTKIVSRHTTDSKPVKQEVNSTVILPPLVFPGLTFSLCHAGISKIDIREQMNRMVQDEKQDYRDEISFNNLFIKTNLIPLILFLFLFHPVRYLSNSNLANACMAQQKC